LYDAAKKLTSVDNMARRAVIAAGFSVPSPVKFGSSNWCWSGSVRIAVCVTFKGIIVLGTGALRTICAASAVGNCYQITMEQIKEVVLTVTYDIEFYITRNSDRRAGKRHEDALLTRYGGPISQADCATHENKLIYCFKQMRIHAHEQRDVGHRARGDNGNLRAFPSLPYITNSIGHTNNRRFLRQFTFANHWVVRRR